MPLHLRGLTAGCSLQAIVCPPLVWLLVETLQASISLVGDLLHCETIQMISPPVLVHQSTAATAVAELHWIHQEMPSFVPRLRGWTPTESSD